MNDTIPPPSSKAVPRRVQALVGLRLLEVLRDQDRPGDIMESEDLAVTMPRRLGLSDVVERQIRTFKADAKKGIRLTDGEVMDLFRLVVRRPDGDRVFFRVGEVLARGETSGGWSRLAPRRVQYAVARSRLKKALKKLFGRRMGGVGRGPFSVEGRTMIFIEADPGGDACHFLSGFCQEILHGAGRGEVAVHHSLCQARGDDRCRWEAAFVEGVPEA